MNATRQETALLNLIPHIQTKLGTVAVLNFSQDIPTGWERLTKEEGLNILDKLKSLTTQWSIIAFQTQAFTGRGYGFRISESYGTECGEGFILKRNVNIHN